MAHVDPEATTTMMDVLNDQIRLEEEVGDAAALLSLPAAFE